MVAIMAMPPHATAPPDESQRQSALSALPRRPRESGDPGQQARSSPRHWIPAFAGMTAVDSVARRASSRRSGVERQLYALPVRVVEAGDALDRARVPAPRLERAAEGGGVAVADQRRRAARV